jgi:hypothetical protein
MGIGGEKCKKENTEKKYFSVMRHGIKIMYTGEYIKPKYKNYLFVPKRVSGPHFFIPSGIRYTEL